MRKKEISLGKRKLGPDYPCFIIAEAGINHNGNQEMAFQLVDAAVEARADAVKFQTFIAEKLIISYSQNAEHREITANAHESQLEIAKKLQLSFEDFIEIKNYCDEKGIIFLSTPFDEESADFLDELGTFAFKIPSGEVTNHLFLEHIAKKGKPIIMSTGMCYLGEVDDAVRVIEKAGGKDLVLLHCVSQYPADAADANLRAMQTMSAAFQVPIGYSDHTSGIEIALAAVALGACVIEKHFTLDRNLPGPDHKASIEPHHLKTLIQCIRTVESALGHGLKIPVASEENIRKIARRSIVLKRDIAKGELIDKMMLTAMRPASGIPPNYVNLVEGRRAARLLNGGALLEWNDLG
ncbi:MAG: N-acetylneuraminate synthase [Methanotrichaceae archaeon]|nr:N-acetylneuraminate synthase [Methanotrichaceae archaeon]